MGSNYIGLTSRVRYEAQSLLKSGCSPESVAAQLRVDVLAVKALLRPRKVVRRVVVEPPAAEEPKSESELLVESVYAAIRKWKTVRVDEVGEFAVCQFCGTESIIDDRWHASQHKHLATCIVANGTRISAILRASLG